MNPVLNPAPCVAASGIDGPARWVAEAGATYYLVRESQAYNQQPAIEFTVSCCELSCAGPSGTWWSDALSPDAVFSDPLHRLHRRDLRLRAPLR